ncbi:MAG TPA: hypothetical protein VMY42_23755 [Thermoguttaceae bacterium]|nr:hypothetical protein [Thermoguttaceae bacterium]
MTTASSRSSAKPRAGTSAPGCIEAGVLYRLDELRSRLGVGFEGWRSLRKAGLEDHVIKIAGRRFLLGDSVLDVFGKLLRKQQAEREQRRLDAAGEDHPR